MDADLKGAALTYIRKLLSRVDVFVSKMATKFALYVHYSYNAQLVFVRYSKLRYGLRLAL